MTQRYTGQDPTFKAMQATIDAGAHVVHLDAATIGEYTACGRITTCERTADIHAVTCAVCLAEHEAYTDTDDTDDTTLWTATMDTDYRIAKACYEREVYPAVLDETYDGPELCVLSTGYAEVWSDGDVTQHGTVLFNVADD